MQWSLNLEEPAPWEGPLPETIREEDRLEAVSRDAGAMRGAAVGLVEPRSEAQLCAWLRAHPSVPVIPQGALTSLTGGATPSGDVVLSLARMKALSIHPQDRRAVAGPGLLLAELQEALAEHGLYYPPAPTHDGASIGGNVATNAAGAATFKYGTTRDWVRRIRLVLRDGQVLDIRRGAFVVRPGDTVALTGNPTRVLRLPTRLSSGLKKSSAGYYTRDPMDLVDLFIGSEGTLGILTEVELGLIPATEVLTGVVFCSSEGQALALAHTLRERSLETRGGHRIGGLDVRSMEYFDRACLDLLQGEGRLDDLRVKPPPGTHACLLFEMEVEEGEEQLMEQVMGEARGPVQDLVDALSVHGAMEGTELALPGQATRRKELSAVREAIPLAVSEWLVRGQRSAPGLHKLGGDMIVPWEVFPQALAAYRDAFRQAGLNVVIYGHISDGNVHPNGLPVSEDDMVVGKQALLGLARQVGALGGCPLSEHGVGRSPLKQKMMEEFRGPEAVAQMRAVKLALDPGWTLSSGVVFSKNEALSDGDGNERR